MRSKNVVAALVVAGALGTGLSAVAAIPANAQPTDSQNDPAFLQAIGDKGLRAKTDRYSIELAHSTCDVLTGGGSIGDALRHVQNATGWKDVDDLGAFGSLAVQAYCPGALPK